MEGGEGGGEVAEVGDVIGEIGLLLLLLLLLWWGLGWWIGRDWEVVLVFFFDGGRWLRRLRRGRGGAEVGLDGWRSGRGCHVEFDRDFEAEEEGVTQIVPFDFYFDLRENKSGSVRFEF